MRKHTVLTALAFAFSLIIGIQLVTSQVGANVIEAIVDIDPDALLLKYDGHGKWITAYIWFSEDDDYDVNDINVSSIFLEVMGGRVPASRHDVQGHILMVKFDRTLVISLLWYVIAHMSPRVKSEVTLEVTGDLNEGGAFEGSDTIKVFYTHL